MVPPKFLILFFRLVSMVAIIPFLCLMYDAIASSTEFPSILIFLKFFIIKSALFAELFF